jgi:hypothetical protein
MTIGRDRSDLLGQLGEPSFGLELSCVFTPDLPREIEDFDAQVDSLVLRYDDAICNLTVGKNDGLG